MPLSNQQAAAAAILILIFAVASCSWFQGSDPAPLSPTVVTAPDTGIPFETKEPETYQADFITIAGEAETRSHFSRKAGMWRFDSFTDDKPSRSIVRGEKLVHVDHTSKQYSEPLIDGPDPKPEFLGDLTTSLLYENETAKFEKLGVEGSFERFKVTVEGMGSTSTIVFDNAIKMVVRHEFEGGFAFEMRNFTLEVDEAMFAIPTGYRKVAWSVFAK